MLMCMPQCPQSYGIKIQSLVSFVIFLLGSGHSSVHIALVSIICSIRGWCWGEMTTVYVLPELDLPQQQRHVNINLLLHKLLPSRKVFMETFLVPAPACRILAVVWNCRAAHKQQLNTPGQNNAVSKSWFTLYQDIYSWLAVLWTQDDSSGAEEIVRWCRYLDNPLIITHGNSGVEAAEAAPVTT